MGIINCSVCGSMNDSQWENCCECSNQLLDAETIARAEAREDCHEILDDACEQFELRGLHHLQAYKQLRALRDSTMKGKVRTQPVPNQVFAIPVRENGKRTTFYTEVLPFVPGPGVEVMGEPVRMVAAQTVGVPDEKPLPDLMLSSYHEAIGWNAYRKALLAGTPTKPDAQGDDWLTLAHEMEALGNRYWKAAVRERGPGAVQWLRNEETGCMFVFTRGEYADRLQEFCASLPRQ